MHSALSSLIVTATPSAAEEGSAANPPPPAPPSAADTVVAAAFTQSIGTNPAVLQTEVPASTLAAPLFALLALGALAFALTRRRRSLGRSITLVESAPLGPKRSLVIADVMGERLVLGVSEAGISVLSTRPSPEPQPFVVPAPVTLHGVPDAPRMSFFDRLFGRVPKPPASFDEALRDTLEDQELRAKLALGQRSVVP
ncbi:MAG: flagellar biosynthetic protein FliO [Myxococcaceae bacterium]|nr:flagellar biosynthetic protein FliO [Myxococcaceae bacterium]